MRIWFNNQNVVIDKWHDKTDLLKYLDRCEDGKLLFDYGQESNELYRSISIYSDYPRKFGIGFITEYQGLLPQVLFLNDTETVLIGTTDAIIGCDLKSKKLLFKINTGGSIFWEFLIGDNKEIIIIACEYSVFTINKQGTKLWEYTCDVLQNYYIKDDFLFIEDMAKAKIKININTGKVESC